MHFGALFLALASISAMVLLLLATTTHPVFRSISHPPVIQPKPYVTATSSTIRPRHIGPATLPYDMPRREWTISTNQPKGSSGGQTSSFTYPTVMLLVPLCMCALLMRISRKLRYIVRYSLWPAANNSLVSHNLNGLIPDSFHHVPHVHFAVFQVESFMGVAWKPHPDASPSPCWPLPPGPVSRTWLYELRRDAEIAERMRVPPDQREIELDEFGFRKKWVKSVVPDTMSNAFGKVDWHLKENMYNVIVDVRDARVPQSSLHPFYKELIKVARVHIICYTHAEDLPSHDIARIMDWTEQTYGKTTPIFFFNLRNIKDYNAQQVKIDLHDFQYVISQACRVSDVSRIFFVGMPNSGKSSLIYPLTLRTLQLRWGKNFEDHAPRISGDPGSTKGIRPYPSVNQPRWLWSIDTPGLPAPPEAFQLDDELFFKLCLTGQVEEPSGVNAVDIADYALWKCNQARKFFYVPLLKLSQPTDDIYAVLKQIATVFPAEEGPSALQSSARMFVELCEDYVFRGMLLDKLPTTRHPKTGEEECPITMNINGPVVATNFSMDTFDLHLSTKHNPTDQPWSTPLRAAYHGSSNQYAGSSSVAINTNNAVQSSSLGGKTYGNAAYEAPNWDYQRHGSQSLMNSTSVPYGQAARQGVATSQTSEYYADQPADSHNLWAAHMNQPATGQQNAKAEQPTMHSQSLQRNSTGKTWQETWSSAPPWEKARSVPPQGGTKDHHSEAPTPPQNVEPTTPRPAASPTVQRDNSQSVAYSKQWTPADRPQVIQVKNDSAFWKKSDGATWQPPSVVDDLWSPQSKIKSSPSQNLAGRLWYNQAQDNAVSTNREETSALDEDENEDEDVLSSLVDWPKAKDTITSFDTWYEKKNAYTSMLANVDPTLEWTVPAVRPPIFDLALRNALFVMKNIPFAVVVEIRDPRTPRSSTHSYLSRLADEAKVHFVVYTHADVMSSEDIQKVMRYTQGNLKARCKDHQGEHASCIWFLNTKDAAKLDLRNTRLHFGAFYEALDEACGRTDTKDVLVMGVPNVGKSSLIMCLTQHLTEVRKKKGKHHCPRIADQVGTTLGNKRHCFMENPNRFLVDTPGLPIHYSKYAMRPELYYKLVLINSCRKIEDHDHQEFGRYLLWKCQKMGFTKWLDTIQLPRTEQDITVVLDRLDPDRSLKRVRSRVNRLLDILRENGFDALIYDDLPVYEISQNIEVSVDLSARIVATDYQPGMFSRITKAELRPITLKRLPKQFR